MAKTKEESTPWTNVHNKVVKNIKQKIKNILCSSLPHPTSLKIVETNAFDLEYDGLLMQILNNQDVIRYYSGIWKPTQEKYSTIKKIY